MPDKKPTRADLLAAADKLVSDLIAPDLKVLFCGINPSLYSAYTGYHFARPGNRFWPTLYKAGFSDRLLTPADEQELLNRGYGITSLVQRATATADELSNEELITGGERLRAKVEQYRPQAIAILGIGAYRTAFNRPQAKMGRQPEPIGRSATWVLPNPSGLNAHYTLDDLGRVFMEFRLEAESLVG